MALDWEQVVVDAADPMSLGRWWAEALGWVVVSDAPDEYEIRPEQVTLAGPEGNEFCALGPRGGLSHT
ncbi:VOC family protein [Streptomyces sp. S.PNR 29]|uniref:VOC family protein n=1 Tax=Streptomyces sp. S.PNR 29 TaxID=2973805 RepID=UPI0025B259B8|nr:VOC family protein [Streptomyces sp. S.PNR 29]MDN0199011.1 hypothetical protein [Streptomyces sp. S.PNR 29]